MRLALGAGGAPDVLVEEAQLDGWAPASDWRIGIGGRCNNDYAMSLERKMAADVAAVDISPAPGGTAKGKAPAGSFRLAFARISPPALAT